MLASHATMRADTLATTRLPRGHHICLSTIAYLHVEVPDAPLVLAEPASHSGRRRFCAVAIAGRLLQAKSAAILVDQDVDRYAAVPEVGGLAERLHMPVAGDRLGENGDRPDVSELRQHLQRQGKLSADPSGHRGCPLPAVHRLPADSRGPRATHCVAARRHEIRARGHSVDIGEGNHQAVTLKETLRGVLEALRQGAGQPASARLYRQRRVIMGMARPG